MSNGGGFPVDYPVTSLDNLDLEDNFINEHGQERPLDSMYDEDNISLELDALDDQTIANKLKTSVANLFKFGKRKQFEYLGDTIELFDRTRSQSSFIDEDDEDIHRFMFDENGQDMVQKKRYKKMVGRLSFGLLLATLVLIAFIVQVKTSLSTPEPSTSSTIEEEQQEEPNKPDNNNNNNNNDDGTLSTSALMNGIPKTILTNGTNEFYPTTILISLDGFHPHYISPELTPFLHNLMIGSYGAPYMIPSFPSSTFPNHWTLVTGLYPNDHGIVGNTFWDSATDAQYINVDPKLSLDPQWWGGEPVWRTAYNQNISTGIHMWPGSEVVFPEGNPMEVDKYNGSEVLSVKVDRLLGWLDRGIESRPELMLSYVPTIDSLGHQYGVEGEELQKGLVYVDNFLDSLFLGVYERNLTDIVNVVIVSDHGMAPTSNKRLVYLDDLVDLFKIDHIDGWPLFGLRPYADVSVDEVYDEIMGNYKTHKMKEHFNVYLREDLPEEWKFGGKFENQYSSRIAPIWVIPDVGYSITTKEDMEKKDGEYTPHGVHGYNNTELLMRAIFIGTGPYFTEKLGTTDIKLKPFANTEVYNIICDSLSMTPSASNTTMKSGQGSYVNSMNVLSQGWKDELSYPDVSFPLEIIHKNATYDMLYRQDGDSVDEEPVKPFDPTSTSSSTTYSVTPSSTSSTLKSDVVSSTFSDVSVTEAPTSDSDEVDIVNGGDVEDDDSEEEKEENDDDEDEDEDGGDDKDDDRKSDGKSKSKGKFFEELGDLYDSIEEFVDDTIDDIEDMFDKPKHKKPDSDD